MEFQALEIFFLALIFLTLIVVAYLGRARDNPPQRLRDGWGAPVDRWRDLDSIAEYHRWKETAGEGSAFLDDRTWIDLYMDEVFSEIDRTRSSIGNQLLYHRLRSTPTEDEADRFERLIHYYGENEEPRFAAQLLLSRLSHAAGYRLWTLCQEDGVDARWWYGFFPVLTASVVASAIAIPFWSRAFLVLLGFVIVNIALRAKVWLRVFPLLGTFKEIGPLLRCAKKVFSDPEVAKILGAGLLKADVEAVKSLETTAKWAGRNSSIESELIGTFYEYLNLLLLLDANAVFFSTRTLRKSGSSLLHIIEALGEVDAAISTASLRAGSDDWTIPKFTAPGTRSELNDAWHPLVEAVVPNSIVMSPGRGIILTGSNMSGKSTFLRTVGVTVVLAQTLNTCPARRYSSPRLRVRSAIGRADDQTAGKSYYLMEVEAVLELVRASEGADPHLFIFDELFRGTNTIERLSAGEAVLQALPSDSEGQSRHVVIAATHDGELVQMLEKMYDPYHFEETIEPDGLTFDYKIRPGPTRTRSAIALLEINGAPSEILEQARARAAQLDSM